MDRSKFLSKVIGIYFIVVSLAMLLNMDRFSSHVNSLINDLPLMFVTGFFTLILGILMVVTHNIWQWSWRVIITILAWITFIKGASILLFPGAMDQITIAFLQSPNAAYIAAFIDLILGVLLCYFGFKKR